MKRDPFSLKELTSWIATKPKSRRYCYDDQGRCLLAQWFEFCDRPVFALGNVTVVFKFGSGHVLPESFTHIAMTKPHTFGAALSRARTQR
jgi:hypothetical protein